MIATRGIVGWALILGYGASLVTLGQLLHRIFG